MVIEERKKGLKQRLTTTTTTTTTNTGKVVVNKSDHQLTKPLPKPLKLVFHLIIFFETWNTFFVLF